jgi:tRNA G26 N,N-dimethylase Trm1
MAQTVGYLRCGKTTHFVIPPTVRDLTGDGRCPRCGRRNSFTGPFWCFSKLVDFYLCLCGVRYEPSGRADMVGITDC